MKNTAKIICAVLCLVLLFCACGKVSDGKVTDKDNSTNKGESILNDMTDMSGMTGNGSTSAPSASQGAENAGNTTAKGTALENEPQTGKTVLKGELTGIGETLTGFKKLNTVHFTVKDPDNTRGLSNKKICHSHGPASGGKPHSTVIEFQKTFDRYNAVTLDTKSTEKCLYLTFDCGYEYESLTSKILDTLSEKQVPAAFFCTLHHIKTQPELISRMIKDGHIVGNHSTTHPSFAEITRSKMAEEIEECDNFLRENYGYSARFFRFPAGEYTENALELVNSIGFTSVFWSVAYSDWDVNNPHGKDYAVKTVTERLHPGAVILLHSVSKDNAEALGEIIDTARSQGYVFKSLEDYRPEI